MARQRMRLSPLPPGQGAPACEPWRPLRADDRPALGPLLWQSYHGTIDDGGETEADAANEVVRLFAGDYGPLWMDASCVVARGSELLSASLVTRHQGAPLLAFSLTLPAWRRRGLASGLIRSSCDALARAGERELRLVVTVGNTAAIGMYERLGFVVEPAT